MSTNVDFASIIEDIKKDYFGVLIKSWKTTPLMNMETLEDIGVIIKMYLNSEFAYDIAVLYDWGERLGADSCTVGIEKNKLVLNFKIHTKKSNDNLNGLYESWYENGKRSIRCNYKDADLDGLYERWYKNGQIEVRCRYKRGEIDGVYESWYYEGQRQIRCNYKNGKFDGLFEQWYDNGQMMTRKNFKDNKLDGLYEEYDENGKLIKRLTFKDSEIVNNC